MTSIGGFRTPRVTRTNTLRLSVWVNSLLASAPAVTLGSGNAHVFPQLRGHGGLSGAGHSKRFTFTAAVRGRGGLSAVVHPRQTVSASLRGAAGLQGATRNVTAALRGRGVLSGSAEPFLLPQLAGVGVLSVSRRVRFTSGAAPHSSGVLVARVEPKFTVSASLSGRGTPVAATRSTLASLHGGGVLQGGIRNFTLMLSGSGVLSATASAYFLAGQGSLSVLMTPKFVPTLAGHGVLSVQISRAITLNGLGVLSPAARMFSIQLPAPLGGVGVVSATAWNRVSVPAGLSGLGVLSAAARLYRTSVPAGLSGSGVLSAAARLYRTSTGGATAGTGTLSTIVHGSGVTFDALGTGGAPSGTSKISSMTWTHTASAGAFVIVAIGSQSTSISNPFTVTYGSVPMVLLAASGFSGATSTVYYGLANVAGGTQTVLVSATPSQYMCGNSVSFWNVGLVALSKVNGQGKSPSETVNCSANQMIMQTFTNYGYDAGPTSGQSALAGGLLRWTGYFTFEAQ